MCVHYYQFSCYALHVVYQHRNGSTCRPVIREPRTPITTVAADDEFTPHVSTTTYKNKRISSLFDNTKPSGRRRTCCPSSIRTFSPLSFTVLPSRACTLSARRSPAQTRNRKSNKVIPLCIVKRVDIYDNRSWTFVPSRCTGTLSPFRNSKTSSTVS